MCTMQFARGLGFRHCLPVLAVCLGLSAPAAHAQLAINAGAGFADSGNAVAIDNAGNVYLSGLFGQTVDFDPGPGIVNLTAPAGFYNFIASYDPTGAVNYAIAFPSNGGGTRERGIAVDDGGNLFVTGQFAGLTDFDPGPGEEILNAGAGNVFLASYDAAGALRFAFNLPNDEPFVGELGADLALDAVGNVYITGFFGGETDFDPTAGEFVLQSNGISDVFLASYTSDGGGLRFAISVGGSLADRGLGIDVDDSGNSYITGAFRDTVDFDPDTGTTSLTSVGNEDAFLASYDSGGALRYAIAVGGSDTIIGRDVALDGAGNAFVTGQFQGTADFDPGAGQFDVTSGGNDDIFLASFTDSGTLRFAFGIGQGNSEIGYGVVVGPSGDVYATGSFRNSPDFDPGPGVHELTTFSTDDAYVARYSNGGTFVSAYSFSTTTQSVISGRGPAGSSASPRPEMTLWVVVENEYALTNVPPLL